jgi:hypothetical protein
MLALAGECKPRDSQCEPLARSYRLAQTAHRGR